MNKHKQIEKACKVCGKKFMARACDKRANRGRACSFMCSGRLGGKSKGAHPIAEGAHLLDSRLDGCNKQ